LGLDKTYFADTKPVEDIISFNLILAKGTSSDELTATLANEFIIILPLVATFQPGSSIPKAMLWIVSVQNVTSPPRWEVKPPNTLDGM
jgi:hypothetical protein